MTGRWASTMGAMVLAMEVTSGCQTGPDPPAAVQAPSPVQQLPDRLYLGKPAAEWLRAVKEQDRKALQPLLAEELSLIPVAIEGLGSDEARVRVWCSCQLGEAGGVGIAPEVVEALEPAVPGLLRILKDDREEGARWCAAWALGQIGPRAKAAVPALVKTLESTSDFGQPDESFRVRAARSLGWIGEPEATPTLRQALDDPNAALRRAAAGALWHLGKTNPRAVDRVAPVLMEALKHRDKWVRYEAHMGLVEFGGEYELKARAAVKEDAELRELTG